MLNWPAMKKFKIALLLTSLIIVIIFAALFFLGYFKAKGAGLVVNSIPVSAVFIDEVQVGNTPYKATLDPKEISLKLVPASGSTPLAIYETRLNLSSGIETIVNRELGETEESSSGEVVSFEKVSKGETSLSIISVPDAAQISVDGQVRGFAPYKTSSILSGEHQVIISAPDYNQRALQVKTKEGYKLIIIAKLSINQEEQKKSFDSAQDQKKVTYVEILTTPTGFLRVRQEASTSAAEIGQIKPGQKLELVEEKEGWFRITFTTDKIGWISAQYAKKLEESAPSPSPISSPSPKASPTNSPKPTTSPKPSSSPGV